MSGFLERWGTEEAASEAKSRMLDEFGTKGEALPLPAAAHPGPVGTTSPSSVQAERKGIGGPDQRRVISSASPRNHENSNRSDAFNKIAALLAIAYRRSQELQRQQVNRLQNSVDGELANSATSSVHGVVP